MLSDADVACVAVGLALWLIKSKRRMTAGSNSGTDE